MIDQNNVLDKLLDLDNRSLEEKFLLGPELEFGIGEIWDGVFERGFRGFWYFFEFPMWFILMILFISQAKNTFHLFYRDWYILYKYMTIFKSFINYSIIQYFLTYYL
jgi:hypothetical protein